MVQITLTGAQASKATLDRLTAALGPDAVGTAMEVAVEGKVKANFDILSRTPNKLGGQTTAFWKRAGDSVTTKVSGSTVTLTITQKGVALQYYGGTVKPSGKPSEITGKPIKFLTIPKVAAAHGKSVATLRSLGVDLYPGRGGLLRQAGDTRNPDTDEMWFVLAKKATIKPNPRVLPPASEITAAAAEALDNALAAIIDGAAPPPTSTAPQ